LSAAQESGEPERGDLAAGTLPSVLVIMGVSGSGKSTIAELLARELGWPFRDADEFHPRANVEKMKSGVPLTDADRWPWLHAIAAFIDETRARGEHAIVTCSALKRAYRRIIIGERRDVRLVYLKGDQALIASRLASRHGHFMPPALLQSQFDALEEPGADERPITVPIDPRAEEIASRILAELGLDTVAQAAR
jgi:carbohydrate kinase (thermoresistant glucokinase family)